MLLRLDARWHYLKGLLHEHSSLHLERLEAVKNSLPYDFFDSLARQLLNETWAPLIIRSFTPLMLDFTTRLLEQLAASEDTDVEWHERAFRALAKIAELHKDSQLLIAQFLRHSKVLPWERLLRSDPSLLDADVLEGLLHSTLGLIQTFPELQDQWNFSPTFKLMQHESATVQRLACQIAVLSQHLTEQGRNALYTQFLGSNTPVVEVTLLEPLQSAKLQTLLATDNDQLSEYAEGVDDLIDVTPYLHPRVASIGRQLLPRVSTDCPPTGMVTTASVQCSLTALATALRLRMPILLAGATGSGKTMLVEQLAQYTGHVGEQQLLRIQMGDQTDPKMLLGSYVCTEVPGQFRYQEGVVTQAVKAGRWLLIEDLDLAPMEVVSTLLPLVESQQLFIPSRGESLSAAPGFQLFATQRSVSGSSRSSINLLQTHFTVVSLANYTNPELVDIITQRFPTLASTATALVQTFAKLRGGAGSGVDDVLLAHRRHLKALSARDLVRWASRIVDCPNPPTKEWIFQEGLDCFIAMVADGTARRSVALQLAQSLDIPPAEADNFLSSHQPQVHHSDASITVGRCALLRSPSSDVKATGHNLAYAFTKTSLRLLEQITVCIRRREPALLVGETGTGKTTTVQYLARQLNKNLVVINMSQQSESSDLIGQFKPVDVRALVEPLADKFRRLFVKTFSRKQNAAFLSKVDLALVKGKWAALLSAFASTLEKVDKRLEAEGDGAGPKTMHPNIRAGWLDFKTQQRQVAIQVEQAKKGFAFAFVEGTLTQALKRGDWVLLDEINLASAETLECLNGLLDSETGSLTLTERGDLTAVERHPDFRLFACMNPATDVGKRNLPAGTRNRFLELYVDDCLDPDDLSIVVDAYLIKLCGAASRSFVPRIVDFYLQTQAMVANGELRDGSNHKPHFSLRSLCRALVHAGALYAVYGLHRSIFEGFSMSFLTQLDQPSHTAVAKLLDAVLLDASSKSQLKILPKCPSALLEDDHRRGEEHVAVFEYWLTIGAQAEPVNPADYILTPTIENHLRGVTRAVASGRFPILLQGPTSSGKTSMVTYLAARTGHRLIRINNHEHTDIQEYIGSYMADSSGRLVFTHGALVQAVKHGYWIVLDELNLAPTDVLEALNRLLDDNRELYIPETQETIRAHPDFMLFATQNPPGSYGGRKVLSRAFRNRFIELHFGNIPNPELEIILRDRSKIPASLSKKLIKILKKLQVLRTSSNLFAGKEGFITLRDLFRWAERYKQQQVATETLAQAQQRVEAVVPEPPTKRNRRDEHPTLATFFDHNMALACDGYMLLAERARRPEDQAQIRAVIEQVLGVEINLETLYSGSISPLYQAMQQQMVHASDPTHLLFPFRHVVWTKAMRRMFCMVERCLQVNEPVLLVGETGTGKTTVCQIIAILLSRNLRYLSCHQNTETSDFLGGLRPVRTTVENTDEPSRLFEWHDGPLIEAMRQGDLFLMDEISLADDSVLERLNSVLETSRQLVLAERGGTDSVETVTAHECFAILATMNPGGDFGKKELSPALRNRFTEMWIPAVTDQQDLLDIVSHALVTEDDRCVQFAQSILDFPLWLTTSLHFTQAVSLRDYLAWARFIASSVATIGPAAAFVHGGCLVFVDGLEDRVEGSNVTVRQHAVAQLLSYLDTAGQQAVVAAGLDDGALVPTLSAGSDAEYGMAPFYISTGSEIAQDASFTLQAPTTAQNMYRVLRALQVAKPVLLEGSPGVGKTTLVMALAAATGHPIERVNLSEQTDVMDLFGTDLPVEGKVGEFAWRDGPLLKAMKQGHWIVLDELNLASQSVLEGLNACLDHRGEVYIPEIGRSFAIPPGQFRLFACQNPVHQGGGRKGLPKSFLNRFTQVQVGSLNVADMTIIVKARYPMLAAAILEAIVGFNMDVHALTQHLTSVGNDVNLRDVFRWCDLLVVNQNDNTKEPRFYAATVYASRVQYIPESQWLRLLNERFSTIGSIQAGATNPKPSVVDSTDILDLLDLTLPLPQPSWERFSSAGLILREGELLCGPAVLPRNPFTRGRTTGSSPWYTLQPTITLIPSQYDGLSQIALGLSQAWMVNVVGRHGCGKTKAVQTLAALCQQELAVFSMNSSVDTMELLGGFEQIDLSQERNELMESLQDAVAVTLQLLVYQRSNELIAAWSNICDHLAALLQRNGYHQTEGSSHDTTIDYARLHSLVGQLQSCCSSCDETENQTEALRLLSKLAAAAQLLQSSEMTKKTGAFEWRDGPLITAMKKGQWLLIDNVNFCSPAVLDRLNGLLEPNGCLFVNERGVIDGEIPKILPHPNFKLIFTMDPKFGSLSPAMRNRGIEVVLCENDSEASLSDIAATALHPKAAASLAKLVQQLATDTPWVLHAAATSAYQAAKHMSHLAAALQTAGMPTTLSIVRAAKQSLHTTTTTDSDALDIVLQSVGTSLSPGHVALGIPTFSQYQGLSTLLTVLTGLDSTAVSGIVRQEIITWIDLSSNNLPHSWMVALFMELGIEGAPLARADVANSSILSALQFVGTSERLLKGLANPAQIPWLCLELQHGVARSIHSTQASMTAQVNSDKDLPFKRRSYLAQSSLCKAGELSRSQLRLSTTEHVYRTLQASLDWLSSWWSSAEVRILEDFILLVGYRSQPLVLTKLALQLCAAIVHHTTCPKPIALESILAVLMSDLQAALSSMPAIEAVPITKLQTYFGRLGADLPMGRSTIDQSVRGELFHTQPLRSQLGYQLAKGFSEQALEVSVAASASALRPNGSFLINDVSDQHCWFKMTPALNSLLVDIKASLKKVDTPEAGVQTELSPELAASLSSTFSDVDTATSELGVTLQATMHKVTGHLEAATLDRDVSSSHNRALQAQLWALGDYLVLKSSAKALECAQAWLDNPAQDVLEQLRACVSDCLTLLKGCTTHPLTLVASLQELSWLLSSETASAPTSQSKASIWELFCHYEMLLWNSASDQFSVVQKHLPVTLRGAEQVSEMDGVEEDVSVDEKLSPTSPVGPLVLQRDVSLQVLLALLDVAKTPLDSWARKKEQLAMLHKELVSSSRLVIQPVGTGGSTLIQVALRTLESNSSGLEQHLDVRQLQERLVAHSAGDAHSAAVLVLQAAELLSVSVPASKVDSNAARTIRLKFLNGIFGDAQAMQTMQSIIDSRCSGQAHTVWSEALERSMQSVVHGASVLLSESAFRAPDATESFAELYSLLAGLTQSTASVGNLTQLVASKGQEFAHREAVVQDSFSAVIQRLWAFVSYPDVVIPAVACLFSIKHALRLLIEPKIQPSKTECQKVQLAAFPQTVQENLQAPSLRLVSALKTNTETLKSDGGVWMKAFLHQLRSELYPEGARMEVHQHHLEGFSLLSEKLLEAWDEAERQRQAKEEEDASLYKKREHSADTDEELSEKELKRLFPDYFTSFQDLQRDWGDIPDDKPEVEEEDAVDVSLLDPKLLQDVVFTHELMFSVIPLYERRIDMEQSLLKSQRRAETRTADGRKTMRENVLTAVQLTTQLVKPTIDKHAYALRLTGGCLFLASIAQLSAQISDSEGTIEGSVFHPPTFYDFYRDPFVSEAQALQPVVQGFLLRVEQLLVEWPDHPSLTQIKVVCQRILSFEVSSPIPKLLTGLDLLLRKANDWQQVAAKHVSVQNHMDNVTQLIIQWRKLELKHWPEMIPVVWNQVKQDAAKQFLILRRVLFGLPPALHECVYREQPMTSEVQQATMTHLSSILGALRAFFDSSCLGEFLPRLDLLWTFSQQLVTEGMQLSSPIEDPDTCALVSMYKDKLANMIHNVCKLYVQHVPAIENAIRAVRLPMEKEIKSYVKIVKWKDTNYAAMKESADKTHRAMFKFVRTYQKAMAEPAAGQFLQLKTGFEFLANTYAVEALQEGLAEVADDTSESPAMSLTQALGQVDVTDSNVPDTLDDLARLTRRSGRLTSRLKLGVLGHESAVVVGDTAVAIIERVQQLQQWDRDSIKRQLEQKEKKDQEKKAKEKSKKDGPEAETKTELSTKEKANMRKHGKIMKQKALSGLVKRLSEMGLSYRATAVKPLVVEQLYYTISSLATSSQVPAAVSLLARCNEYFPRLVARLEAVRSVQNKPHQDIEPSLAEKSIGLFEHLLSVVDKQRTLLGGMLSENDELNGLLDSIKNWAQPDLCLIAPVERTLGSFSLLRAELIRVVNELDTMLDSMSGDVRKTNACCFDLEAAVAVVEQLRGLASLLAEIEIPTLTSLSGWMQKERGTALVRAAGSALDASLPVFASAKAVFAEWPQAGMVLDQAWRALVEGSAQLKGQLVTMDAQINLSKPEFPEKAVTSLERVLVRLQSLGQQLDKISMTDESKELLAMHQRLTTLYRSLNVRQIVATLLDTMADVDHKGWATVLYHALPVLQQYARASTSLLIGFLQLHKETSKLTYVMGSLVKDLLTKGYCVPPELEDEEGEGENHDGMELDGTGVGQGSGSKDVSNEIEDEEQVLGTQNEVEEPQPEQDDIDEEDNGLEMANDFDGEMYDQDDKDDEDRDDESDDDDMEDMEEQMGEVDGENAETLDKDMWAGDSDNEEDQPGDGQEQGGEETGETELGAKQNEDAPDDKPNPQDQSKEQSPEEKPEQDNSEEINDDYESGEEGEAPEHQDQGKAEKQEQQKPDDLDLDDDLNLDGGMDEDMDEPEQDNPEEEKEGELENEVDMGGEDNDDGGRENQEGQDGLEEEEQQLAEDTDLPQVESEQHQDMDNDESGGSDAEGEEQNKPEGDDQQDETPNEEEPQTDEAQAMVLDEDETGVDPQDNEEEEPTNNGPRNGDDDTEETKPEEQAEGEDDAPVPDESTGQPQHDATVQADDENVDPSAPTAAPMPDTSSRQAPQGQEQSASADSSAAQDTISGEQQSTTTDTSTTQRDSFEHKQDTNPFRDLGSTLEAWKERLQVHDLDELDRQEMQQPDAQPEEDVAADAYAFAKEEEQHDAQAMAAATQDQEQIQGQMDIDEEQPDKLKEQADMTADQLAESKPEDQGQAEPLPEDDASRAMDSTADVVEKPGDEGTAGDRAENDLQSQTQDDSVLRERPDVQPHLADSADSDIKEEDVEHDRAEVEHDLAELHAHAIEGISLNEAIAMWHRLETLTSMVSERLTEQLRLVLEASLASRMSGDYRTGKRLNMRKIIPYIASQFRKDKIWLRRSKPSKREYQVMLAIDNSSSMQLYHSKQMALESLAIITNALVKLEVGDLSVLGFGERIDTVHTFGQSFSATQGGQWLQQLTFDQQSTAIGDLLERAALLMQEASDERSRQPNLAVSQLLFVLSDSDNLYQGGKAKVEQWCHALRDRGVFVVFVIFDAPEKQHSVLDQKTVSFTPSGVVTEEYMDRFTDKNYILLRDIQTLPQQLGDTLRQWFEMVASSD